MTESQPRAWGDAAGSGRLRTRPADFRVEEVLGFEPEGDGEHCFLYVEKTGLSTAEVAQRLARHADVPRSGVGYSGLKDRQAVTRQWFSVGPVGRSEPDWSSLERENELRLLVARRHRRKLRRGVHRANRFELVLRDLSATAESLTPRLTQIAEQGVPNYFGPQRFGRGGSTLTQGRQWLADGQPRIKRDRRSLYLSALRASLFNTLLGLRVADGSWNRVLAGDACALHGTRSLFTCELPDADIEARCAAHDLHPALPLWGEGEPIASIERHRDQYLALADSSVIADALENLGMSLSYRSARLFPDDFCWEFCDDGLLKLDFSLGAGSYATAVVAELLNFSEGDAGSGYSGE